MGDTRHVRWKRPRRSRGGSLAAGGSLDRALSSRDESPDALLRRLEQGHWFLKHRAKGDKPHKLRMEFRQHNSCDVRLSSNCKRTGTAYRCANGCDFDC